MSITEESNGRWPELIRELTEIPESALDGKHHPCPCSGEGTDRFRWSDRNGTGSFFCACTTGGNGFDLLKCARGWGFREAAREVSEYLGLQPDPKKSMEHRQKARFLKRIVTESMPPRLNVRRYLAARGLRPGDDILEHPGLTYWHEGKPRGRHPAMVGVVRDIYGRAVTCHVTYLTPTGLKADLPGPSRKLMPAVGSVIGSAVRLAPAAPRMGIAEGVETALAASLMFGIPVWSTISRAGLEKVTLPDVVERVLVFGDHDASFAGQAGAYRAAEMQQARGLEAEVHIPNELGDWNDVLRREPEIDAQSGRPGG